MNTDLLMHENGLDNAGKSQLPLDELLYQMKNAKAIELLDAAVNGFGLGMARLSIRNDGTFLTLSHRGSAASSGLEMASVWLMALEGHALNPCASTTTDHSMTKRPPLLGVGTSGQPVLSACVSATSPVISTTMRPAC